MPPWTVTRGVGHGVVGSDREADSAMFEVVDGHVGKGDDSGIGFVDESVVELFESGHRLR